MNNSKPLLIDLTQEEDLRKTVTNCSFAKVYQTQLTGRGLAHQGHPACEYKEHSCQQHGIVIHLKPEHNSLRLLGDLVEVENPQVGDIAIIPAGVNHWQRIETEAHEGLILTIEPQIIARISHETIDPNHIELLPTFAQADLLIYSIALNIKANLDSDCYDRLYTESLFNTLFLHLLRNYCTREFKPEIASGGLAPYKLKQVLDLIGNRWSEDITIEEMANHTDLSLSYFARQFKKSTGLTPHQYVTQERIKRVKQLLKDKRLSLAEVATDCGFTHQSHMGKLFKQLVGVTPKKYRNEIE